MQVSPEQVRAARAMLGWNQDSLRKRAGVAYATVEAAERPEEIQRIAPADLDRIRRALEEERVEFIPRGVRWRRPDAEERLKLIQEISQRSAAKLQGHAPLTDDDLYDEDGLPA